MFIILRKFIILKWKIYHLGTRILKLDSRNISKGLRSFQAMPWSSLFLAHIEIPNPDYASGKLELTTLSEPSEIIRFSKKNADTQFFGIRDETTRSPISEEPTQWNRQH